MLPILILVVLSMADIQFNLRIPEELKDKIKAAASRSGRSINAEAQIRLEKSFNHDLQMALKVEEQLANSYKNLETIKTFIDVIQNLQETVTKQSLIIEKIAKEKE
ncbi:Arc family DNA-binding protein [Acinetobacter soli]|uniref:Arc family DNA-binding protein n=1 Tax=Acinetobacter soli TaxID=487316 RepID=UPI0020919B06|nr:Arc family DNA-binding protein [Acinetobacter soli]